MILYQNARAQFQGGVRLPEPAGVQVRFERDAAGVVQFIAVWRLGRGKVTRPATDRDFIEHSGAAAAFRGAVNAQLDRAVPG